MHTYKCVEVTGFIGKTLRYRHAESQSKTLLGNESTYRHAVSQIQTLLGNEFTYPQCVNTVRSQAVLVKVLCQALQSKDGLIIT